MQRKYSWSLGLPYNCFQFIPPRLLLLILEWGEGNLILKGVSYKTLEVSVS